MLSLPFESLFSAQNLKTAFERIHSKAVGADGVSIDDYRKELTVNLEKLRNELISGSYAPEPLLKAKLPKDGGEFRPIAISSVKDKIVQNALSQALSPYFDKSFSNASYAYRKDKSHIKAIHRTRDYIAHGFVFVLKTDIESFFENIDHDSLLAILDNNISDKRITKLISLLLQNGLFERQRYSAHTLGVHQGDSLSPLLSNIYLDQMDKLLDERNIPFVRYADDFVVLGKSQDEMRTSKKLLDEFLPSIKLRLSGEKTKLIHSKDGFTFLGARFKGKEITIDNDAIQKQISRIAKLSKSKISFDNYINELNETIKGVKRYLLQIVNEDSPQIAYIESAVIDSIAAKITHSKTSGEITTKVAFKEKLSKVEAISKNKEATADAMTALAIAKAYDKMSATESVKAGTAPLEKKKREYAQEYAKSSTLFIGKPGMFLGLAKNRFSLKDGGKPTKHIPLDQIRHIVISTANAGFSSAVIEACSRHSIAVDFIDERHGHYAQLVGFNASISQLAHLQLSLIASGGHLYLAKEFIEGKAKNQLNYLKYIDRYHNKLEAHIKKMENSLKTLKTTAKDGQMALMGYEGALSAIYWDGVKTLLGEDIFSGRITQGATDTINSALNYGYAILYGRAQKALVRAGLALYISFLHSADGRKPTLVFDFVEEFRAYVVDKTVIALASKSDVLSVKEGRLTDKAKKALLEDLLERLGGYVTWKKESRRMDDIIEEQAYLLARHIKGEAKYNSFIGKY
ncbi:MAG: CRISPR-associated endonuclease Cas1 [Campylobacterales bacterium]|nr:CRISPR-associated endonuclease Cas1 [Campylobacterales bacterium]